MDFETLKELVEIVNRNKIKQIEVLGNPDQKESRVEDFYQMIINGNLKNDHEAVLYFFEREDTSYYLYRRLKTKLARQLTNTALFIDTNQAIFNERSKALYQCYSDFAAAQILLMRGAQKSAIFLFEHILEQIERYEFISLAAEVTRWLRYLYSRVTGDKSRHRYYSKLHKQYEEKRRLEMLATDYHENAMHYYLESRSPDEQVFKYAAMCYEELWPQTDKIDTVNFYHYTYQIGLLKHFSENNCSGALALCDEALSKMQNKANVNRQMIVGYLINKILCFRQLRMFDIKDTQETIDLFNAMAESGSFNWFRGREQHFQYCIHAGKYREALEIYTESVKYANFHNLPALDKDNWNLYGGYFHLLAAMGQVEEHKVKEAVGPFRYNRFINEIDILDKDKTGMNIPLVLLPVMFGLAKGSIYESDFSADALEKYRKRYMDNRMNRRSACFTNLLLALAKMPFEVIDIKKKIHKELEKLRKEPIRFARQSIAVEIIPYEDLWAMLTGEEQ
jgi:hypothetical protein